jgi:hypothetical protein
VWTDTLVAPAPTAGPNVAKEAVVAMLGFFTRLLAALRKDPDRLALASGVVLSRPENPSRNFSRQR